MSSAEGNNRSSDEGREVRPPGNGHEGAAAKRVASETGHRGAEGEVSRRRFRARGGENHAPRPIRPAKHRKGGDYLGNYPASTVVKHRPVDLAAHRMFAAEIAHIPPEKR